MLESDKELLRANGWMPFGGDKWWWHPDLGDSRGELAEDALTLEREIAHSRMLADLDGEYDLGDGI